MLKVLLEGAAVGGCKPSTTFQIPTPRKFHFQVSNTLRCFAQLRSLRVCIAFALLLHNCYVTVVVITQMQNYVVGSRTCITFHVFATCIFVHVHFHMCAFCMCCAGVAFDFTAMRETNRYITYIHRWKFTFNFSDLRSQAVVIISLR